MKRRFSALCLCVLLLCQPALAWAEEEAEIVPLSTSQLICEKGQYVLTGQRAMVDFEWLRMLNEDCVGWLYQEETLFSEAVVQGKDNLYYQTRSFDRFNVSSKSCAYLDAEGSPLMDDALVEIYGSGRSSGSLEELNGYSSQMFYDAHPALRLLTPQGDYQADVFASLKTSQRLRESWLSPQGEETRADWLSRVLASSEIQPAPAALPQNAERLLAITIHNGDNTRRVILCTLRPIRYDTQEAVELTNAALDRLPTLSGTVTTEPLGKTMVYFQNDEPWNMMRYESAKTSIFRRFGGGGCGPTAAAIVIANLVEMDELPKLAQYSVDGLGTLFCSCSVNRVYCNHLHAPYRLETAEQYLRYLPVVMADFAAGNNVWGVNSRPTNSRGSNMKFLEPLCEIFGLKLVKEGNIQDALERLKGKRGDAMVVCCALRGGPFTNSSHYVVLAAVDEEYFYVIDPLYREEYDDPYRAIDAVLAPGIVRVKLENWRLCGLTVDGYIEKNATVQESGEEAAGGADG